MSFEKVDFTKHVHEFAKALGLEWQGKANARYIQTPDAKHPRQKAYKVVLFDEEKIDEEKILKAALDLVQEVFDKHGPGWFRTTHNSIVCYLGDRYDSSDIVNVADDGTETVKLGIYYFHEKAIGDVPRWP